MAILGMKWGNSIIERTLNEHLEVVDVIDENGSEVHFIEVRINDDDWAMLVKQLNKFGYHPTKKARIIVNH